MVAATTSGKTLYAMSAWAVLAFSVFTGALAQTSTSLVEITLTSAPESYVPSDLKKLEGGILIMVPRLTVAHTGRRRRARQLRRL